MPTLTQLSKDLGVSTSTISRALNNDSSLNISQATRDKIICHAKDIGYISKISKSKPILMLYHCNPTIEDDLNDPFFKEIKEAVIKICDQESIVLHIYRRGEIPETTTNINGIIAIGSYNITEIELLQSYSTNITFVNSFPDLKHFDSVVVDDGQAIEDMIDYLALSGAEHIAFIGGNEYALGETEPRLNRRKSHFEYYINKLHIRNTVLIGEYSYQSGFQLAYELFNNTESVDSIICASDTIAHGVLDALSSLGKTTPSQVQLIGFNDDKFIDEKNLGITSMRVHKTHMAMYAIENLLNRIKSPSSIHTRTVLPATMIKRNTTK